MESCILGAMSNAPVAEIRSNTFSVAGLWAVDCVGEEEDEEEEGEEEEEEGAGEALRSLGEAAGDCLIVKGETGARVGEVEEEMPAVRLGVAEDDGVVCACCECCV